MLGHDQGASCIDRDVSKLGPPSWDMSMMTIKKHSNRNQLFEQADIEVGRSTRNNRNNQIKLMGRFQCGEPIARTNSGQMSGRPIGLQSGLHMGVKSGVQMCLQSGIQQGSQEWSTHGPMKWCTNRSADWPTDRL